MPTRRHMPSGAHRPRYDTRRAESGRCSKVFARTRGGIQTDKIKFCSFSAGARALPCHVSCDRRLFRTNFRLFAKNFRLSTKKYEEFQAPILPCAAPAPCRRRPHARRLIGCLSTSTLQEPTFAPPQTWHCRLRTLRSCALACRATREFA